MFGEFLSRTVEKKAVPLPLHPAFSDLYLFPSQRAVL